MLPALALFATFLLYPMLAAAVYSGYTWSGTKQEGFVGLANYAALFTKLPFAEQLPRAFGHNLAFLVLTLLMQNTVGMFLAVQLGKFARVQRLLRTLYAMPYLVSPLVIGYLWSLLLSDSFGVINALLRAVGLDALAQPWLGDPKLALWVAVLISVWQWLGFPVLLYGAALAGLPAELGDAASVDGATGWQRFRHITLPLLTPAIGTISILTFIATMEIFPLVYALGGSNGSPAGATDVLSLLFYRTSFQSGGMNAIGMSSALATVMFLFIFGGAMVATRVLRRREANLS